jgi:hypothetical protein
MPDNLTQEENNKLMALVEKKMLSYREMMKSVSDPDRKSVFPFPFALTVGEDKSFVVNAMAFVTVENKIIPVFAKIVDEDTIVFYPSKRLTAALEKEVAEGEKAKAEALVAPEHSEST